MIIESTFCTLEGVDDIFEVLEFDGFDGFDGLEKLRFGAPFDDIVGFIEFAVFGTFEHRIKIGLPDKPGRPGGNRGGPAGLPMTKQVALRLHCD